jgi:hypothetical protein
VSPSAGKYVVLQQTPAGDWRVLGEANRRPGLPARKARTQAVRDALGREPKDGDVFRVLPHSEWRLSADV